MKSIILIGFMGAGKTTIGRKLARRRQWKFVDTDELIETQSGKKISEIFAREGEAAFRALETETLRTLTESTEPMVIAAGGGLPMQPQNRPLLKELGTVVFLEAGIDTLVRRLSGDTSRPLLQGGSLRERISSLMDQRLATYEEVADVTVSTENSFAHILEEIEKTVENL